MKRKFINSIQFLDFGSAKTVLLFLVANSFLSCDTVKRSGSINSYNKAIKSKYAEFNEDDYIIYRRWVSGTCQGLKKQDKRSYYLTLENEFILDEFKLPELDSNEFTILGTYQLEENVDQIFVSLEKRHTNYLVDGNYDLTKLWAFDEAKNKWVKKNASRYLRIHGGFFLKKDTSAFSGYDYFNELVKNKYILDSVKAN